jgi:hypothetical protein
MEGRRAVLAFSGARFDGRDTLQSRALGSLTRAFESFVRIRRAGLEARAGWRSEVET